MTIPAKQNLYRKYRPQTFAELMGQEHIVNTLQSAVSSDRVSHAYMFSGPRGTGKTSMARLLSKILNCLSPIKNETTGLNDACRKCENCISIEEQNFVDIIEIDAASNNGVEDIRQMRDRVKYKPAIGKYKVYIIDEVHMLSGSAFNAFLKTLEEPPERVLFVLATTDPQKVPATIISRCQCFDFHSISKKVIQERLKEICDIESKSNKEFPLVEEQALALIAESAQGGFRDALSLLDQISSYSVGGKVSSEHVLEMTRRLGYNTLKEIADSIFQKKLKKLIVELNELFFKGYEPVTIGRDLLEYMRRCMLLKIDNNINDVIEIPDDQVKEMVEVIKPLGLDFIVRIVSSLEKISLSLRKSLHSGILLETELVKLSSENSETNYEVLNERIEKLEQNVTKIIKNSRKYVHARPRTQVNETPISYSRPTAPSDNMMPKDSEIGEFGKFRAILSKKSKICSALLVSAPNPEIVDGCLVIYVAQSFAIPRLNEEKNLKLILEAAKEVYKNIKSIKITDKKESLKPADNKQSKISHREQIKKIDESTRKKMLKKPSIADAIDVFGGEIIDIKENLS